MTNVQLLRKHGDVILTSPIRSMSRSWNIYIYIYIGITITRSFTAQTFSLAGSSGACHIVIQTKQRCYCDVEAA